MNPNSDITRPSRIATVFDVVAILLLSGTFSLAQFSVRQGRAVLSADSLQYLDNAESILSADENPSFGYRKPGYSYLLAGLIAWLGTHVWGFAAANYLLQSFFPLIAYLLGRCLRSRGVGWLAAILMIARLQDSIWAERVMSEVPYTFVSSIGVLLIAIALSKLGGATTNVADGNSSHALGKRNGDHMGSSFQHYSLFFIAGVSMAAAWFIRPVAVAVIAAALVLVIWFGRKRISRLLVCVCLLIVPFLGVFVAECALNAKAGGPFQPCTGTLGAMILMRARHIEDLPPPNSAAMTKCVELLPERSVNDAYRVNHVDVWVARDHAIREQGMNDWEADRVLGAAGWELIARHPGQYVATSLKLFSRTLLRQTDGPSLSRVSATELRPIIEHSSARDDLQFQEHWYAYWALPNRSLEESRELFAKWNDSANTKAPIEGEPFATLRYLAMSATVNDVLATIAKVGSLWPGFAIVLCGVLGLNRRICAFVAICYVFDALLVGAFGASEQANARYLWVWIVPDTTLAAALFAPLVTRRVPS